MVEQKIPFEKLREFLLEALDSFEEADTKISVDFNKGVSLRLNLDASI